MPNLIWPWSLPILLLYLLRLYGENAWKCLILKSVASLQTQVLYSARS